MEVIKSLTTKGNLVSQEPFTLWSKAVVSVSWSDPSYSALKLNTNSLS